MNNVATNPASWVAQKLRQRFWSRLRGLKLIRESDLIRVHRHAQQRSITPEEAIIVLGLLSEDQVLGILTGERPVLASA